MKINNMKKLFLSLLALAAISITHAQKNKLQSAINYFRYEEYDKAKEAIDLASDHEDTKIMGKTWLWRGKIYAALATTKKEELKSLSENPLDEAYNAYTKAYELGGKKLDENDLNNSFALLINPSFTKGVDYYNKADYKNAVEMFERTAKINEKFNLVDTLSIYNAALAAEKGGDHDKALANYKKCLSYGYGGAGMYTTVANVYALKGDKKAALDFVVNEGRKKYPSNQDLINYEFSLYLQDNNYEGALSSINASIENDPDNEVYYYNRGFLYDQMGEIPKAAENYQKALNLKKDYFDAAYNLGALFFNKGADLVKEANDLPLKEATKAEGLKKEAQNYFTKALAPLENAHELNPEDKNTMISLRSIYARTGANEKYKEINDKLTN